MIGGGEVFDESVVFVVPRPVWGGYEGLRSNGGCLDAWCVGLCGRVRPNVRTTVDKSRDQMFPLGVR